MAFRGDKRNDYTEATALLTKLDVYTTNMFWDGLVPGLGTLNHFWSRAIEWENTMLIAKKVGLPSCINELPTLTQRLLKILEPNVEHIRSRIIEKPRDNYNLLCRPDPILLFVWLDSVLTAAGSQMAGQFMAPIRQDEFERSFIAQATKLLTALGPAIVEAQYNKTNPLGGMLDAGAQEGHWGRPDGEYFQLGLKHCLNNLFLILQRNLKKAVNLAELAQRVRKET